MGKYAQYRRQSGLKEKTGRIRKGKAGGWWGQPEEKEKDANTPSNFTFERGIRVEPPEPPSLRVLFVNVCNSSPEEWQVHCQEKEMPFSVYWGCRGVGWRSGGAAFAMHTHPHPIAYN